MLFRVKVCGFNRIENLVCNFRILEFLDFVGTIFVIERNCRTIFYGSLEIVNRNVAAESSFGDVVIFQKRSARKADTRSRREQGAHVICKNSILAAMCFVGHHQNIVIRINRGQIFLVELLNQREDETRVALEFCDKVVPARGNELGCFYLAEHSAIFKRIANLFVQFVTVRKNDDCGRTFCTSTNLLRQEQHRVAFAAPLRMPENAQLAIAKFAVFVCFERLVYTKILVVAGENLDRISIGMIVKNEICQQVKECFFFANPAKHRLECNGTHIGFLEAFPFVEKIILAAKRSDFRLYAIRKHQKCVIIEKLRNRRKVIRVVVVVGVLHSDIVTLEFHKQKRDAINKADYIGTAAINFAVNFHLLDGEKIVVLRVRKINDESPLDIRSSIGFLVRDRNAIANKAVLFFVDLKQRRCAERCRKLLNGFINLRRRYPRIQLLKCFAKIPMQQNLSVRGAPECSVFA